MDYKVLLIISSFVVLILLNWFLSKKNRERRTNYYRNEYLKSDDWKRKRYLVLKRDNGRCVYCGQPATQVHHTKYSKRNIGREPIKWLVSICNQCHEAKHKKRFQPILKDNELKRNYGFDNDTVRFRD
jgi:5-methylcytosine-specific restriction endonuclease McrA